MTAYFTGLFRTLNGTLAGVGIKNGVKFSRVILEPINEMDAKLIGTLDIPKPRDVAISRDEAISGIVDALNALDRILLEDGEQG